ncbi:MAG: ATP-grasp domain-containing protein [Candidatus Hodarchaeota archaeon]
MDKKEKSVLIIGFNTRPLAYSLNKAGYLVYVVDFFGDLDLFPYIEDGIIITKELGTSYNVIKNDYQQFLIQYSTKLLQKYPKIKNLIIASGLDDYIEERSQILEMIKDKCYEVKNLNNSIDSIKRARDIIKIYKILLTEGYKVPITEVFEDPSKITSTIVNPFILKKKKSSGGINVYKIEDRDQLSFLIKKFQVKGFLPSDWLVQEYISGIPVSCTTISNGNESKVVSINRQIIGLKFVNPPKEFMYCGNIVPGNLLSEENKLISEISIKLANNLELKGINGFDFVLKNNYPYLMEINPRIPGSINASEHSLNINLMDLHIKSFYKNNWREIMDIIDNSVYKKYATKLIYFTPKYVSIDKIEQVNNLKYIHDKTEPIKNLFKGEPICSILYMAENFSNSFFGALKIADEITKILS